MHKGLLLLWEKDDPSKLPNKQIDKIRRILTVLDTIKTLEPLRQFPGYKLHALIGKLKGFWSVTVTGNYRIIFRFEKENVYDVDYTDYH
ncbi:MAG: type II toxin-antitoxin system RelE/ParE family toxin [Melioribacteraceae bacterium]|nr:type II toxin-antitoxin system RelE/ParE family toxin [Melioribacteraceae bacterium]MCF8353694.1 type II toxin-antitoxin system RelE/ParE family toxin [Melioribacteraceae bacterium]MCF8396076.1 type II toxin-antitoxin system RelE/ParE family toxin [Melioribacteraceae bacterium]